MLKKLLFLMLLMPTLLLAQHSINGTFTPAEDFKTAIIYKVTPNESVYVTHSEIEEDGTFKVELDSTVTKGMYRIVYAVPQEEFNFDIIYNAAEDVVFTFNQETGIKFQESIENKLVNSYTNSMSMVSQSIGNFFRQQSTDTLALESIFKTQKQTQDSFEEAAKNTIALNFIKANRPYIPEGYEDLTTYISNLQAHFFDHVDFNNDVLQSSNFLIERTLNYVFGMDAYGEDQVTTYVMNTKDVVQAMSEAPVNIKITLLQVLWQQMVETNFDEVANYISDEFLLPLAKEHELHELAEQLITYKNTSIGALAPDFELETQVNAVKTRTSLHKLEGAKKYLVVFWSSTCGHCLEEIPQLYSYINSLEKDTIKVIAVGLEDEPFEWRKLTIEYPEFTHVLGIGKWDNSIGNSYNVQSTPSYYVLSEDKTILAKPFDFQAFKKWMEE